MTRYDIIRGVASPDSELVNPYHYQLQIETVEEALSVTQSYIGRPLPLETVVLFEEMMNRLIKRSNERGLQGWEFEGMSLESDQKFDTLHARCIFRKAKQNALSPETLGPGEQRAGIYNYLGIDGLHDLWNPSPAVPASASNQTRT